MPITDLVNPIGSSHFTLKGINMTSTNIYTHLDRTPYTYLIGWSKHNKWYYGVRYAKKCHPSDLWTKYFTSSKYIRKFRNENGEPDIVEIRKTFNTPKAAIQWENKILLKLWNKKEFWLNKRFCNTKFIPTDESIIKMLNHPNRFSFTTENQSGTKNHMFGKSKEKHWNYNKKRSEETRNKISLNHTNVVGKNNPNSKHIQLISPAGKIYDCFGNFALTCKELNLPKSTMWNTILFKQQEVFSGPCAGWKAKYILPISE